MSEAGKEGAGAQEERPRRAGASWERGKLGGRQPAPPHKGASQGLGGRGTNPGLQVQGTDTRMDQRPQDLLKTEQTSRDRASREALDTGAGSRLFTLPQTHGECLPDAWHQSPPWGHKNARFMPSTAGSMCHHASTVMKRELGTGLRHSPASPEPDLPAAVPELGPWTGLPAGLETDCPCPSAGGGALA